MVFDMTNCEFCSIVQGEFDSETIYADDKVVALMHLKPAAPGHVLLFTKEHHSIIEQVPDFVIGHAFVIANKVSSAIFESLGVHGTNIIIENGAVAGQTIPHFCMHILPRNESDGLKLDWQPKSVTDDDSDIAQFQIKEQAESVHPDLFEHEKKEETHEIKKEPLKPLPRQLRRIP